MNWINKLCSTIALLFLVSFSLIGSNFGFKSGYEAKKLAESGSSVGLIIKSDHPNLDDRLQDFNGHIKFSLGDIYSIEVQGIYLDAFLHSGLANRVEHFSPGTALMDSALVANHILGIHQGLAPLASSYTGNGVLIGIIDNGIDFTHDDFKRADGTSRIRYIWDQNVGSPSNPPAPYNYGEEWTWFDIDNSLCTHSEPGFSHGTCVSGIAAGDGSAVDDYKGVAPDAEIAVVAVQYGADFLTRVADGVDYLYKKADALGKTCVINTSVGTYYGGRDGRDLTSQLITGLIKEKEGRSLVAASGNAGHINYHLGYEVTADSSFTWFKDIAFGSFVYFDVWSDSADFENVFFSVGADDAAFNFHGQTDYLNVSQNFTLSDTSTDDYLALYVTDSLGDSVGLVEIYAYYENKSYHLEFVITPRVITDLWRFTTKGSGRFDCWAHKALIGTSNIMTVGLPTTAQVPEMTTYKLPDNLKTLVSSWQCADEVITVGNHINKTHYYDVDSNYVLADGNATVVGELFYTSSIGPTRDNKVKPNLTATGSTTVATGHSGIVTSYLGNANRFKVGLGGKHIRNGGTSMASPIVAGIAALYLEKEPTASWWEIKQVIEQTTFEDQHTGNNLPSGEWGYGKVCGFEALTLDVVKGCTDPTAFNYDANANVDDGSCVAVVMGCTDSTALNYNPLANTDDGSCVYDTIDGVENIFEAAISVYPNPSDGRLIVSYDGQHSAETPVFELMDATGRLVLTTPLQGGNQIIDTDRLNNGVYVYRLRVNNHTFVSNQWVLTR